MIKMKINHKKVEQLKSFYGVKLRGDETFDEPPLPPPEPAMYLVSVILFSE